MQDDTISPLIQLSFLEESPASLPACQPASHAGRRQGEADDRWLWPDTLRIVREIQPQACLFENVSGLRSLNGGNSFREILGELADAGFDVIWRHLRASDVGAPHRRERVFIVAYSKSSQWRQGDPTARTLVGDGTVPAGWEEVAGGAGVSGADVAHTQGIRSGSRRPKRQRQQRDSQPDINGELAHTDGAGRGQELPGHEDGTPGSDLQLAHATSGGQTDQPRGTDPAALVSALVGAGSGIISRNSTEGIQLAGRTETSGAGHVGNPSDERFSQPRQPALAAQGGAGLVLQPERSGSQLAHTQSIPERHGNDGAISAFGTAASADQTPARGLAGVGRSAGLSGADEDRSVERGLGRVFDGLPDRMDFIRREFPWPARPGETQFAWEPPRTTRKQPLRASRLKALGNAVVWILAAPIAEEIYSYLQETDYEGGTQPTPRSSQTPQAPDVDLIQQEGQTL